MDCSLFTEICHTFAYLLPLVMLLLLPELSLFTLQDRSPLHVSKPSVLFTTLYYIKSNATYNHSKAYSTKSEILGKKDSKGLIC